MSAELANRVEQLARIAVLTDSGDLAGLVALQEQAVSLAGDLQQQGQAALVDLAKQISGLAEAIVVRTAPDVDAAFAGIGSAIENLQKAVAAGPRVETDTALLATWIAGCDLSLTELEGHLLKLDKAPTDGEVLAEVRRAMHTLKGECGVLSLHAAQRLFHEAESLIDMRAAAGGVPADPLLALLDWFKVYLARLAVNPAAAPEDVERVLGVITGAQNTTANAPAATSPASSAAPAPVAPVPTPAPTAASEGSATPAPVAAVAPGAVAPVVESPVAASVSAPEPAPAPVPAPVAAAPAPAAAPGERVLFAPQPGTEDNLSEFLCEAQDHISASEEALLALEHDRSNIELINTVFRAFHTIKGVSGFMGLKPIVSLAHSAEQLLDGARAGALVLGRTELDLVLASCDMMTRLLGVLQSKEAPPRSDFDALVSGLDRAAVKPGSAAPVHAPAASNDVPAAAPTPTQAAPAAAATEMAAEAPATAPAPSSTTPAPAPSTAGAQPAAPASKQAEAVAARAAKADQTVKVSTTRMDSLVTMVGELVIAQQMVVQDLKGLATDGHRVQRTLGHMGKMIRDLQEVSMSLRMVNLKSTFQRMTRLVRDVSQKTGKQIEVVTEGDDVELDRNVVEAITDPLVHMIRNSCDHGVEGAEERKAAGKGPVGQVLLKAFHAGGSIVIEIADDGRGLRRDKLIAKAKSKGILAADADEAAMSDAEVFNLIFLPGFSTAEKVTDISGRGVGMDVVRRNIEALRGKIEIRSQPGKGTTFHLRLPLTMAIIDGMVVRVGAQRYVLPTLSIHQSFRPKDEDVRTVLGAGEMVKVRGATLPVYRLNRTLRLNDGAQSIAEGLLIMMEADGSKFCLMVDEVLGQHQVVIKTLDQTGQRLEGVSGGAILGDGRVALILDVTQVMTLARSRWSEASITESKPAAQFAARS